jgi:hypothetical protein
MNKQNKSKVTAESVIRHIRKAFSVMPEYEKLRLWDILTALRGPDHLSAHVKDATTALIRGAVFGDVSRKMDIFNFAVIRSKDKEEYIFNFAAVIRSEDKEEYVAARQNLFDTSVKGESSHFVRHTYDAFKTLGLNYSMNNGKIPTFGEKPKRKSK